MIRSNASPLRRSRDRGAAAVELALVMPLLLLIIFGIVDFGRMYNTQITLTQAAREGARAASYNQTAAQVSARVTLAAQDINKPGHQATVTAQTACPNVAATAEVTVEYDFMFITPFAIFAGMFGATPAGNYDLTSTAVVTCAS